MRSAVQKPLCYIHHQEAKKRMVVHQGHHIVSILGLNNAIAIQRCGRVTLRPIVIEGESIIHWRTNLNQSLSSLIKPGGPCVVGSIRCCDRTLIEKYKFLHFVSPSNESLLALEGYLTVS